jgi:hypothetical protein
VSVPAEQLACKSAARHRRCWEERREPGMEVALATATPSRCGAKLELKPVGRCPKPGLR